MKGASCNKTKLHGSSCNANKPICSVSLGILFKFGKSVNVIASHALPERSVRVAERLALPTSDHGVAGSNPAGGEILPEPKRRFIVQSLSRSPFHRLEMTEILLKGRKTLTHPSSRSSRVSPFV